MSTQARTDPFGDLSAFDTVPVKAALSSHIDIIAEAEGFPSRPSGRRGSGGQSREEPKRQRRYVTGRNQQLNVKATAETIEKLHKVADELRLPLGAVLDMAIDALIGQRGS